MARGLLVVVLIAGVATASSGCGGSAGVPARAGGPVAKPRPSGHVAYPPVLIEIARLEATRSAGVPRLIALTEHPELRVRTRAARGLGRAGGSAALAVLRRLATHARHLEVRVAAVHGLVANAPVMIEVERAALAKLLAGLLRSSRDAATRAASLRGLGRVAGADALAVIAGQLAATEPRVRSAACLALGRFGRRKLALNAGTRAQLRRLATAPATSPGERWAATYALASEHQPAADDHATLLALSALSRHADAKMRAQAVYGLARRYASVAYDERKPFWVSLRDRDWRVRVQAVRGLSRPATNAQDHEALATWLVRELALHLGGRRGGPRIQPVVEGLRGLVPFAREAAVRAAAEAIYRVADKRLREPGSDQRLSISMTHCLAAALRVRGAAVFSTVDQCGGARDRGWPDHLRRILAIEVLTAGFGSDPRQRYEQLYRHASATDPRIRAAALKGLVTFLDKPDYTAVVTRALSDGMADAAVEVVGAMVEVTGALVRERHALASRLLEAAARRARSRKPLDAELHISLLDLIASARYAAATDLCRRGRTDANASVRHAGRTCVIALTGNDPGPGTASRAPALPPVPLDAVLGRRLVWEVVTTRGRFRVALDSEAAPWHVAAVVTLTRRARYDGLLWHRVVADFVVQGGDPRGSGWGGPGFVLPAEPSATSFGTGSVGIADAGLDTGSSQWFVMHSPAPRLDNRYTRIGTVVSGQTVVDSLVVGDRILRASVVEER